MKTNYYKFVAGQKMAKSILIAGHLWLEHVLVRSISPILPNPDALFKERSVNFHMLVSLCEAHGIFEPPLAVALRRINALRNKRAHRATYELLDDPELNALWSSVREIGDANTLPELSDFDGAIEATAILLERRARAVGATDLEAIVPEIPDYVLRASRLSDMYEEIKALRGMELPLSEFESRFARVRPEVLKGNPAHLTVSVSLWGFQLKVPEEQLALDVMEAVDLGDDATTSLAAFERLTHAVTLKKRDEIRALLRRKLFAARATVIACFSLMEAYLEWACLGLPSDRGPDDSLSPQPEAT